MSNIVSFPAQPHARARAGSKSRAAKRVKSADLKPAARAREVARTASHQCDGMLSRSDHFCTLAAVQPKPTSEAMTPYVGHRSMTARNDEGQTGLFMPESLRQFVLFGKDPVSRDCDWPGNDTAAMTKSQAKSDYKSEFIARTKQAREARGYSQVQVAELLGIDQPKYSKYETRSYMPHDLIPLFCLACAVETAWLFTGKGRMAAAPAALRESAPKPKPKKRSRAA